MSYKQQEMIAFNYLKQALVILKQNPEALYTLSLTNKHKNAYGAVASVEQSISDSVHITLSRPFLQGQWTLNVNQQKHTFVQDIDSITQADITQTLCILWQQDTVLALAHTDHEEQALIDAKKRLNKKRKLLKKRVKILDELAA